MSYDMSIGDFDGNCTFNVSKVFYDHIPDYGNGGGLREFSGKTGKECAVILSEAWKRLDTTRCQMWISDAVGEPAMSAKYDAPNGWGSLIGALCFLGEFTAACAISPRKKVYLSL